MISHSNKVYKLVNSGSNLSLRNTKCWVSIQISNWNLNLTVDSCKWSLQMILLIIKWPSFNPHPSIRGTLGKALLSILVVNNWINVMFFKFFGKVRKMVKSYFIPRLSSPAWYYCALKLHSLLTWNKRTWPNLSPHSWGVMLFRDSICCYES